jgi:hypothetical protein
MGCAATDNPWLVSSTTPLSNARREKYWPIMLTSYLPGIAVHGPTRLENRVIGCLSLTVA